MLASLVSDEVRVVVFVGRKEATEARDSLPAHCAVAKDDRLALLVVGESAAQPGFRAIFLERFAGRFDVDFAVPEDGFDQREPVPALPVPDVLLAPILVLASFPFEGGDPAGIGRLHDEAVPVRRRFVDLESLLSPLFRLLKHGFGEEGGVAGALVGRLGHHQISPFKA